MTEAAQAAANATDTPEKEVAEKGASPFLRAVSRGADGGWNQDLVLWAHPEKKTHMHGVLDGKEVIGFFDKTKEGARPYLVLKQRVAGADGAEASYKAVAYGNPINTSKDAANPVYFDTVAFNVGERAIFARVTKACDQSLRDLIGFTSAQVERPAKEAATEGETSAERPRGG